MRNNKHHTDALALVQLWLHGRAQLDDNGGLTFQSRKANSLHEKCRLAYQWILDNAIYCPYTDIEYGPRITLGRAEQQIKLASEDSYASFILLPLLTLMTSRRLLLIGAPGRGKTTVATLMALLAGYRLDEIKHAVQHGHPQMTQADILGSPLPSDLVQARNSADIRVLWRNWIRMRVKIIDEYNRIPTKTQSCLLSLMAEGYAEMYEQIIHSENSAWFLTANDDLGGGTFQVIEALKDRIDIVVRCTPFNTRYLEALAKRIAQAKQPEDFMPTDIIFTSAELDQIAAAIRAIDMPAEVLEVLGFLISQLDFCRRASDTLEFQNKDTLHLAGRRVGHVCTEDCPLDKLENLCTQTESGVSARAYQTIIHYAKALAFFRGQTTVSDEDIRQILPWVLHEKLKPNPQSDFFQKTENHVYQTDKVSWIRQLFDQALTQYAAYQPLRQPIIELQTQATSNNLDGLPPHVLKQQIQTIRQQLEDMVTELELNAPVHNDIVLLKHLYVQYRNQLSVISYQESKL
jgi:MoxR-like ATPase